MRADGGVAATTEHAPAALEPPAGDVFPSPDLFPSQQVRTRTDDRLTQELHAAAERIAHNSVVPTFDRARFSNELATFGFDTPQDLDGVCDWTIAQLASGIVHITHPRYFGLYNPAPTFPSQCADRIAATFNAQLASMTTSSAAVEIENHVVRALGRRAGFGDAACGSFTSGGSEANMTALVVALTRAAPAFSQDGVAAFAGKPVFYVSRDSHMAWLKIAHMCGIGRSGMRTVATDGHGRLDTAELDRAIRRDMATGCVPVMLVATAGTTNAGMIDPLAESAAIAKRYSMWLHVDAAWAGALLASDRLRGTLAGIELADSITIDAHKWFATTMGCGMFITRDAQCLSTAFHAAADYMPSQSASIDPYLTSIQWSRRFLGIRLFMSLATAGWAGYAHHVERAVALADKLRLLMIGHGWTVANDSPAAVLCLVPPDGQASARAIVERVVGAGRCWISLARYEGVDTIRACISNGETTAEDVAQLAAELARAHRMLNGAGDAAHR